MNKNSCDDILYSARDYSSIYVSKFDTKSIEKLKHELDNDKRYSKRKTSGINKRERLVTKILCIDCKNNVCNPGPTPLRRDRPLEIKCIKCGFIYHPYHQN
jgi:hypothetical protein